MSPGGRVFLSVLLVLAILGTGLAVIGLRDADRRSKRDRIATKIEGNLRIHRQRTAMVEGMITSLAATRDGDRAAQVRHQLTLEHARLLRLGQVIEAQLASHAAIGAPWLLGEARTVDATAVRAQLATVP